MQLPASAVTLAELFRERGYATGAFVSVVLLDEESGAAQGFEVYGHPTRPRERPAEHTIADALAWVGSLESGQPFFLWVHLFEPHLPYVLHDEARGELDAGLASRFPSLNWKQFYEVAREHRGEGEDRRQRTRHHNGQFRKGSQSALPLAPLASVHYAHRRLRRAPPDLGTAPAHGGRWRNQ